MALLPDSPTIDIGPGVADGDGIRFEGTAQARAYQLVDVDALLSEIAGLPISEARAILAGLGEATVSVWPEFLGDLPGDPSRIRLESARAIDHGVSHLTMITVVDLSSPVQWCR